MKILVTGGAGYIGSFMTRQLLDQGHQVAVIDSLERGHREAVDARATFKQGSLADQEFVRGVLEQGIEAVIHFAGLIAVGESMHNPGMYFHGNTEVTRGLLDLMHETGVDKIIFSSTAAVYGNPVTMPIPEDHPKDPTNPYGQSKLMIEEMLQWYQEIYGLKYVALRYFNSSGAALDGAFGESHNPETHIIPNAIMAALNNAPFNLFGNDYKTADGTCVRDYIHVLDLIQAHELALQKLVKSSGGYQFNVGTGKGYSNQQVIDMVKEVSKVNFPISVQPRRLGDTDELVADATHIRQELGFSPQYSDLRTIIESAWKWHSQKTT